MFIFASTRDEVFSLVLKDKIYEDILSKFLSNKKERDEFRQHLWLQLCQMPNEKIITSWNQRWFQYLFVSVVKNQIQSSDSPWHLKHRKLLQTNELFEVEDSIEEDLQDLNYKEEKELKIQYIEEAVSTLSSKTEFFIQIELFKLYFFKDMTYREIEKKTKIPLISVHRYVGTAIVLVQGYIKKKYGKELFINN